METVAQARFEGWAVLELFGHQREAGFVTTQYFGNAAMFQLDVPAMDEHEQVTARPGYIDGQWAPAGTKCKKAAVIGRTRLINPSAVYAMNPCSKEAALKAIDEITPREIKIIELANQGQLETSLPGEEGGEDAEEATCPECGVFGGEEHEVGCTQPLIQGAKR